MPQKKELDAVAQRIFDLADARYTEQKDFAAAIGETPSIVSQWRSGVSKSYRNRLSKIALALGTTTDYLLTGEGPKRSKRGKVRKMSIKGAADRKEPSAKLSTPPPPGAGTVLVGSQRVKGGMENIHVMGDIVAGKTSLRENLLKAAFFEGGEDLTQEEMDELWEDAKDYIQYKLDQRRRRKHDQ